MKNKIIRLFSMLTVFAVIFLMSPGVCKAEGADPQSPEMALENARTIAQGWKAFREAHLKDLQKSTDPEDRMILEEQAVLAEAAYQYLSGEDLHWEDGTTLAGFSAAQLVDEIVKLTETNLQLVTEKKYEGLEEHACLDLFGYLQYSAQKLGGLEHHFTPDIEINPVHMILGGLVGVILGAAVMYAIMSKKRKEQ